ncbi:hypothetical protein [Kumtagia ephedrae]|jgi:hypothetical protein|uniref:Outer membrane lipoprotein n=1 Tax=Kumtagia ephedrae TaxID=2116701 RepID=A0A2P7SLL9_9HYPH|nr:hypothetical protein [Mesorhizobium ephedrae]PSJ63390.1 hypothetical protein C7I84_07100 [Mesorhizobium ephedrae]
MIQARKLLSATAVAILAAGISGCVSGGPSGPNSSAMRGVEGDWVSTDGVAVSRFSGGVFTTNALDTGNKLADGSYRINGNVVEITVVSLIRNTTTNVNCAQVSPNQLNCTSSTGQNFVLTRRSAGTA